MKTRLLFFYVLFLSFFGVCDQACACIDDNDEIVEKRINIKADELLVTETGLYLLVDDEAFPLTGVFADENGLYVKVNLRKQDTIRDTCHNGHKIYHYECGGCANWWCLFRCKCHSPWALTNN